MAYLNSPRAKEIAKKLCSQLTELSHIDCEQILFLENDKDKISFYGRIMKIPTIYTILNSRYRFIMEISNEKVKNFNEAQYSLLIYHELRHIHTDFDKIQKHDVEDFYDILIRFGLDWVNNENIPNILEMNQEQFIINGESILDEVNNSLDSLQDEEI